MKTNRCNEWGDQASRKGSRTRAAVWKVSSGEFVKANWSKQTLVENVQMGELAEERVEANIRTRPKVRVDESELRMYKT